MKWINSFLNSKIPFYIYKLNKDDSIIYSNNINNNQSFIILYGIVYILKIFANQEIITLAILEKGNIIHNQGQQENCYYKIIAVKETFLLSFKWQDLIYNNNYINYDLFIQFIRSYEITINKYEMMNNILTHKYIKSRVIQLLFNLSTDFGIIESKRITIPFHISQITIGIITGSSRSTINKILNELCNIQAIGYSYEKHIFIKKPLLLNYVNKIKNELV